MRLLRRLLPAALLAAALTAQGRPLVWSREGTARSTRPLDVPLPELLPGKRYSVLATLSDLDSVGDRMLRVELFDPTGMPTGKVLHAGDPDLHFVFRPRLAGTSVLRITRARDESPVAKPVEDHTRASARDLGLMALQQDGAELANALREGDGEARLADGDAYAGKSALLVKNAWAHFAKNVPGWGFKIAEKPDPGEYRWLRFAWKLPAGETAMLALADAGEFQPQGETRLRYRAGPPIGGQAAVEIAAKAPRAWTVVTRDLWKDGGAFLLTGLALGPCTGSMLFDHCYLARTLEDLDAVTPERVGAAIARGATDGLETLAPREVAPVPGPFADLDGDLAWHVAISEIPLRDGEGKLLESEPNDDWRYADEIELGTPVRGGADDIEYLENQAEGKVGWDWLRFTWREDTPKLVFFSLDYPDRDVPATIQVFAKNEVGALVPYRRGKDTTEVRHDNQDAHLAGWKFVSRVITKGTYWLRVKANHPTWTLHTTVHDVPPYSDPRVAVRVAAEYVAKAGDGFFANVPRGGAVRTRVETNTDETTRCFACHAGHYPVIGNLAAAKNGYRVAERAEFRNLIDRVYNVGTPLYGFDDAAWARFDLAPTTGIARAGTMLCQFEEVVSKRRTDAIAGAARFAELVYAGRDQLPRHGDRTAGGNYEFDGNRPISDARVATEAWRLFAEMGRRTGEQRWLGLAAHMQDLIGTARIKDLEDLVEQTLGMLEMDRERFGKQIAANVAELKNRRHDDGGWVTSEYMTNLQINDVETTGKLDVPGAPSLVFFTAQTAYALWKAGVPLDDPIEKRAVAWLLAQQLEFGGWVDPKGELFKTPYLETKWVLVFLSHVFPENTGPGDAAPEPRVADAPGESFAERIAWLDSLWHADEKHTAGALALAQDRNPLVRTRAALALQRMAWNAADAAPLRGLAPALAKALADPCKEVARAAALALRTLGNQGLGRDELLRALSAPDPRTRRWAARAFVHQSWGLAADARFLEALLERVDDADLVVRMHAIKTVQQWWYRAADPKVKDRIVARLLARARVPGERREVLECLTKGLYNVCDENTVELYGNDLRVLATDAARDAVRKAREQVVERGLAARLAGELAQGTPASRSVVLQALGYRARHGTVSGNDTDDVVFLDAVAAQALAAEVLRALGDGSARIREDAAWAATAVRKHAGRELVLALLAASGDASGAVRNAALRGLDLVEPHGQALPEDAVGRLLAAEPGDAVRDDTLRAILRWLRRDESSRNTAFVPRLVRLAEGAMVLEIQKLALQDLEWAAAGRRDAAARTAIWSALSGPEPALRVEAMVLIERALKQGGFLATGPERWAFVRGALRTQLQEQHERAVRLALWNLADAPWAELLPRLADLLDSRRPQLRKDALGLLLAAKSAGHAVDAALVKALASPDAALRAKAALALGRDPAAVPAPRVDKPERVDSPLDFDTFAAFVNPVLLRRSAAGREACVECHGGRAKDVKLRLHAAEDGAPSEEELVANYNAAVAFVDVAEPTKSPLLLRPLNPDRAIGPLHGDGRHAVSWTEPSDPDFQAVLDWAKGKRLDRAGQFHFDEFRKSVVPIFLETATKGDACWECHNTHNTLFMPEPDESGRYTAQQERQLLDYVLRVVDLRTPEDSMILNKPLYALDNPVRERDPGMPTHGGGPRWPEGKRSWQYRALHGWIEKVAAKR